MSALPSANGNAADSSTHGQTTAKASAGQRAAGPNSRRSRMLSAKAAPPMLRTPSSRMPASAASG